MVEPTFKIKDEKLTPEYGMFVIEPLEPGFGHTLGSALRRVLLVSIPGAAVTSVKISGTKHKFSTIPGLKENVVDLLLNIKGLNLRLLNSKAESTVRLSVRGPKEITAADLELPEDVEVVNKDHYLGFLGDKKAKLDIEFKVEKGLGYLISDDKKVTALGELSTDAIFTPIRRVIADVSSTRVGRQTNLDKLTLQIWTNGVVSPKDALMEAAKILSSYFTQVYQPKEVKVEESSVSLTGIAEATLRMTVDELDLPTRIYNTLRNGGIETIGQLLEVPRKELISMRNMGGKSLEIIDEKLKEKGISLQV